MRLFKKNIVFYVILRKKYRPVIHYIQFVKSAYDIIKKK